MRGGADDRERRLASTKRRQTSRILASKRNGLHTKDKKARLDAGFCFIHFSDRRLKSSVACPPLRLLHGGAAGRQEPQKVNAYVCTQKIKKPARMRAFCFTPLTDIRLKSSVACPPLRLLHGGAAGHQDPRKVNAYVLHTKDKKARSDAGFLFIWVCKS